ncbi:MAG: amidohydrolase [Eubacteriaceae bacterium]|nr:amidohydrolase [Eubacteriaceae bacterium]
MDTILYNGSIETMAGRRVAAAAIKNGRFAYVGEDAAVLALASESTKLIDLKGNFAVPGFADSHIHMLSTGEHMERLDLRGSKSVEELVERGKKYLEAKQIPEGSWIIGVGFNDNGFDEPRMPTKDDLDLVSTAHPIIFTRICGHIGSINSYAIEVCGITTKTASPGGEFYRDANGQLNGILSETALDLPHSAWPQIDKEKAARLLKTASEAYASSGLTAVHSDDLSSLGYNDLKDTALELANQGLLKVRIYEDCQGPTIEAIQELSKQGLKTGVGNSDFSALCVKILADGSLGGATALLREEYNDAPGDKGIAIYTQEEIDGLVKACHDADFGVACHCIGDGALEMFLDALEKSIASNPKPLINRVVHCQIGSKQQYERMAALNVAADIQPPFTATDAPIVLARVGQQRVKESYVWKSLLDYGIQLGGGSDSPVEPFAPLWGIYCAVTRCDGEGKEPWMPDERLSVMQALELYTIGPARLSNNLHNSGTIEAGKYADLVVLESDLFEIDPHSIKDVKVAMTIKGGDVTYSNGLLVEHFFKSGA